MTRAKVVQKKSRPNPDGGGATNERDASADARDRGHAPAEAVCAGETGCSDERPEVRVA